MVSELERGHWNEPSSIELLRKSIALIIFKPIIHLNSIDNESLIKFYSN